MHVKWVLITKRCIDLLQNSSMHMKRSLHYLHAGYFFMFLLFFQNILLGKLSECQIVWIQIKTNKMSVLIRIQTVCNSFRQTTKIAASKERVNSGNKTIPVWFLKVLIDFWLTVKAATLIFKPYFIS